MKKRFLLLFAILLAAFGGIAKHCIAANAGKTGMIEKFIAENIRIDIPATEISKGAEYEFLFRNEKGGFSSEKIDFASLDRAPALHFNYYERENLSGDFALKNLDIGVPEYKWRYERKSFGDFSMATEFYYASDVAKFRDFSRGGKIKNVREWREFSRIVCGLLRGINIIIITLLYLLYMYNKKFPAQFLRLKSLQGGCRA